MRLKKQKGAALIALIIAMILMGALGVGIYTVTTSSNFSELLATRDYNAYQLAKAGMRYAALNESSLIDGTTTSFCMTGGQCFNITRAGNRFTAVGRVNEGTFLAANRSLSYDIASAAPWGGPDKSVGTPDNPNIQISAVPNTFVAITGGPDGDINTPGDNTVTIGNAPGGGLAGDSYASFCFKIPSTNGNCGTDGKCDFGYGINAFFQFRFLTPDTSGDSRAYADGFNFAMMSGITNTMERTGGTGASYINPETSEGELMGYSGPGNTLPTGSALVKDRLGWKPPKIALEFDTYPNQESLSPIGFCANENSTPSALPICEYTQDTQRSIAYGAVDVNGAGHYNFLYDRTATRYGPSGNRRWGVSCDNATFGDPIVGTAKACYLLPTNICAAGSRNDQSVHNHMAIMFWGFKSAEATNIIGRNCYGGSSSVSWDDNIHGLPIPFGVTDNSPQNSWQASTTLGQSTGYYRPNTNQVNWLEDGNQYSVRMEIVRTNTGGGGDYVTKAWVVRSDSIFDSQQSLFKDVTLPFTGLTFNTMRAVTLSALDHDNFSKTLVCITAATGGSRQRMELSNFRYFFPEQAGACSYSLSPTSATYAASGGSGSFATSTTSACYWEASSLASWITINSGKYGRGSGTVNYTVAANPTGNAQRSGNIMVGGQTFTVTQAGYGCTGGTITDSGGKTIHTFTSSGTLSCVSAVSAEVLVIAGGGGAGRGTTNTSRNAGGGGAGGLIYKGNHSIATGSTTVTVGAGGQGSSDTGNHGSNGSNSVFGTLTAIGGGGGGSSSDRNGNSGGSGGGAARRDTSYGTGGSATQSSQGGDSGTYGFGTAGATATSSGAGGGGGADGAGTVTTGGAGKTYWGTTYAIGGSAQSNAADGASNTGNAGNAAAANSDSNGGDGGSGVVIIRY